MTENDEGMKRKLMNRKFRQIIQRIDDARRPQQELERVMGNDQEFAQFVDYMLRVIGFRPNTTDNADGTEESVLQSHYEEQEDLDGMNDNDKFKYLLRKMLIRQGM